MASPLYSLRLALKGLLISFKEWRSDMGIGIRTLFAHPGKSPVSISLAMAPFFLFFISLIIGLPLLGEAYQTHILVSIVSFISLTLMPVALSFPALYFLENKQIPLSRLSKLLLFILPWAAGLIFTALLLPSMEKDKIFVSWIFVIMGTGVSTVILICLKTIMQSIKDQAKSLVQKGEDHSSAHDKLTMMR